MRRAFCRDSVRLRRAESEGLLRPDINPFSADVTRSLVKRAYPVISQEIRRWSKQARLSAEDTEDAEQLAVLWFLWALPEYRCLPAELQRVFSFWQIVSTFVRGQFKDFVRRVRRREAQDAKLTAGRLPTGPMCEDPAVLMERHEFAVELDAVCRRLTPLERSVFDRWVDGVSRDACAGELGISMPALKRLREKVARRLRPVVRKFSGVPDDG
jgi:DNA-directed RNA polymerase specialized sigma24 family protein